MTRRPWSRLATNQDGTTAIEMAVALTAFLLMLFGIFEYGRLLWTRQIVMHAADEAARCYVISSPLCKSGGNVTSAAVKSYAATVAAADGITLPTTDITVSPGTAPTCSSSTGVSFTYYHVTVAYTFTSPLTAFLVLPSSFTVSSQYAC
jgi:Flp pilus assembly protein TadG